MGDWGHLTDSDVEPPAPKVAKTTPQGGKVVQFQWPADLSDSETEDSDVKLVPKEKHSIVAGPTSFPATKATLVLGPNATRCAEIFSGSGNLSNALRRFATTEEFDYLIGGEDHDISDFSTVPCQQQFRTHNVQDRGAHVQFSEDWFSDGIKIECFKFQLGIGHHWLPS